MTMANDWLTLIKNAKKTCMVQNNLKKVHYELGNGKEMVEEYNMDTQVLTRRAWRKKTNIGKEEWDVEIGDPEPKINKLECLVIQEDCNQPFITKRNTKNNIEWRIRNLPYPIDTYNIEANKDKKCLIVRTTNKKYYKIIDIPELEKVNLLPEQKNINFTHKFNTLVITYKKPKEVIELEKAIYEEVKKLTPKNEGVGDCKPS